MESNDQEDFVSQEVDLPVPEHDNSLGVGRSYECVFCKRGFNTAQALGGHMNIHRKDRARNKPSSVVVMNSNKHIEENYSVINPRFYHQTNISTSYQPHYVASHHHYDQPQFNHRSSYFPASAASPAQPFFPNHQRFNPFGFDQWSMSFSMPCGSSVHVEDIEKSRRGVSQEEELDLELRLGGP